MLVSRWCHNETYSLAGVVIGTDLAKKAILIELPADKAEKALPFLVGMLREEGVLRTHCSEPEIRGDRVNGHWGRFAVLTMAHHVSVDFDIRIALEKILKIQESHEKNLKPASGGIWERLTWAGRQPSSKKSPAR